MNKVGVVQGCEGGLGAPRIPRCVHIQGSLFLLISFGGFNFCSKPGSRDFQMVQPSQFFHIMV